MRLIQPGHAAIAGQSNYPYSAMMAQILPAGVVCVEEAGPHRGSLLPAEAEVVAAAVPKRRDEFAAGRTCAHRALAQLGISEAPLLPGAHREPLWPPGIVGSITHCELYSAAAVSWSNDFLTVGIDAKPNRPLPDGVLETIALPEEIAWIRSASPENPAWDRLLFSAKESAFKAWFPIARTWIDFTDARFHAHSDGHGFEVTLVGRHSAIVDAGLATLNGQYRVHHETIATAIAAQFAPYGGRKIDGVLRVPLTKS
jgi:4'-phosphopantetheinyl transferase EntD